MVQCLGIHKIMEYSCLKLPNITKDVRFCNSSWPPFHNDTIMIITNGKAMNPEVNKTSTWNFQEIHILISGNNSPKIIKILDDQVGRFPKFR